MTKKRVPTKAEAEKLSNQELFELFRESGDIELRNLIVEKNLYMVDILVRKYLGKGVDYDDLYQVGAMALVSAVDRFDSSKGYEFSSFATPTILGEIKKYFRDKEWRVKVPRRLKEISGKIPAAKDELEGRLGRAPTLRELSEFMKLSESEVLEAIEGSHAYDTVSLNQTFDEAGEDGENAFLERYASENEKGYDDIEMQEFLEKVFSSFSDTEKKIFQGRFMDSRTQGELAEELGISQMTVSRTEKNIKKKLREEFFR